METGKLYPQGPFKSRKMFVTCLTPWSGWPPMSSIKFKQEHPIVTDIPYSVSLLKTSDILPYFIFVASRSIQGKGG